MVSCQETMVLQAERRRRLKPVRPDVAYRRWFLGVPCPRDDGKKSHWKIQEFFRAMRRVRIKKE